jgi:hypothetical protein
MKVLLKKNLLNEIRKACDGCRKNCLEDFDHTKRAGSTWLNSQTPKKKGWTLHLSMLGYFWGLDVTKIGGERVVGPRLLGICIQCVSVCP